MVLSGHGAPTRWRTRWMDKEYRGTIERCTPVSSEQTTGKTLILLSSIEHSRAVLLEEK